MSDDLRITRDASALIVNWQQDPDSEVGFLEDAIRICAMATNDYRLAELDGQLPPNGWADTHADVKRSLALYEARLAEVLNQEEP